MKKEIGAIACPAHSDSPNVKGKLDKRASVSSELPNLKLNIATPVAVLNDGNSAAVALLNLEERSKKKLIADVSLDVV